MRTFSFLIQDTRYAVPTLAIVTAKDTNRGLELARKLLEESPHHVAVEVHESDTMIARLDRDGVVRLDGADC
jgi:hypothetical protein